MSTLTPTRTKAGTNYRPSGDPARRCGTCSMFRPPDACTLVRGVIRRDAVCDEWERK